MRGKSSGNLEESYRITLCEQSVLTLNFLVIRSDIHAQVINRSGVPPTPTADAEELKRERMRGLGFRLEGL